MGRHAGRTIAAEVTGRAAAREPFSYRDKGTMAIIGKAKAVCVIGGFKTGGFAAWLLWGGVHIAFLIGFRNRLKVLASWFWSWLLNARDARLITGNAALEVPVPLPSDFVRAPAREVFEEQRTPQ
jgi:NADH dehydrogenase